MTRQELKDLLTSMGVDTSDLNADGLQSDVHERIVLKKFDGDKTDVPVETIVIENGEIIERG